MIKKLLSKVSASKHVVRFTDEQIKELIDEKKRFKIGWERKLNFKQQGKQKTISLEIEGEQNQFTIILRANIIDPESFSAIFAVIPKDSTQVFRLRRYDGGSHRHANKIEGTVIDHECHIHFATERYQELGNKEEDYAEQTDRFTNLEEAFRCLIEDCQCFFPNGQQLTTKWF